MDQEEMRKTDQLVPQCWGKLEHDELNAIKPAEWPDPDGWGVGTVNGGTPGPSYMDMYARAFEERDSMLKSGASSEDAEKAMRGALKKHGEAYRAVQETRDRERRIRVEKVFKEMCDESSQARVP